jgi:hypothetical protein
MVFWTATRAKAMGSYTSTVRTSMKLALHQRPTAPSQDMPVASCNDVLPQYLVPASKATVADFPSDRVRTYV